MLALLLLQAAAPSYGPPPMAAEVRGAIEQVTLGPIFREPAACVEHPAGQLPYAGDALGTDCTIMGGIGQQGGYARPFRTDGRANADWYGWHADVLAPVDARVLAVVPNAIENVPGKVGKPPAGMIVLRRADGVIVVLAHVDAVAVKAGDGVAAGQRIARVGNNGFARSPHIHVGAYRDAGAVPLQIRWNLRTLAAPRPN